MKWLTLGALLALLLTIPGALTVTTTTAAALVTHPLLVAFVLGAVARPHLTRRWAR
ncbi:hypothetical protein ABZ439_11480 [Streptomyces sp. NPDC005840]|uniref:hypothetical protein n=1 Tax=Streptomyces sp. NPDC005840 TaxID=3157072 RepID=UPI0033FBE32F